MKIFSLLALSFSATLISSCSSVPTSNYTVIKSTHLKLKGPVPSVGNTISGQKISLGGFSGLMLKENPNPNKDELILETITDRGPNGYLTNNKERPFLLPEFPPQILSLRVNLKDNNFEVTNILKLQKKNGKPLTGLPNKRNEENPIDVMGFMYSLDQDGIDSEALVSDDEGGYWVGEEYSPSLVHFDKHGKMLRRLTPFNELPKMYSERKSNRGFEGIAKDKNKIFGFLQSPLPMDQNFARIVEVDLDTLKTSGEYYYGFEKNLDKIGDAVSIGNNKFLVIEQNGMKGPDSRKYIFKITLNGTDNLVKKELLADLGTTPFKSLEKIEGLAVIDSRKIALVNDNDFQINGPTDTITGFTPINNDLNEMLILEFSQDITK
ncbi:MAG: esterase-like activity of phytase family protein [Bacteriovorax sp.]|nr:esterase-like activity of phytase family protein [Bacteriovorax sp.]